MTGNQCNECENYEGLLTCGAFLGQIPQAILDGEFDHANVYPGQDDESILFKPIDREDD